MTRWLAAAALGAGFAVACGGGSGGGANSNEKVVELDAAERTRVCELAVDLIGPERTIMCPDGITVTIGGENATECVDELTQLAMSAPNCPVTVGQFHACAEAIGDVTEAEVCNNQFPSECTRLMDPACSTMQALLRL